MPAHPHSALRRALALLGATALGAALAGCASGSASSSAGSAPVPGASGLQQPVGASGFAGAALPGGVAAPAFALRDQSARTVSLAEYRGRVVVVAFVYSTCGAPCVVIAQQVRGALDELPAPVPVLLVSADPAADTRARVKRFLAQVSLGPRARYLTGSPARLRRVWRAFHVIGASGHRAAFARSASVFLIDRRGRERVIFQLEQLTPESLSHDIRRLERLIS
jgi:protein SCO1